MPVVHVEEDIARKAVGLLNEYGQVLLQRGEHRAAVSLALVAEELRNSYDYGWHQREALAAGEP